ncbi:hypothetical protein [uncultured Tyzzerella sp.]|uniref:hypothetical protein n=1 Tax=uncultured Tyzzerella sp. TaxID=2321398 RepID=UPI002942D6EA|nr:hypothetical protein [uncultured Tyzzerella sp.]
MKLKRYITSILVVGIIIISRSFSFATDANLINQNSTEINNLSIEEIEDNAINLTDLISIDDELKSIEEQEKEWAELDERVKAGDKDLFPTTEDIQEKGITTKGAYPTRKGTILVTKEFKGITSLTGHAGIIYNATKTIESFPDKFSPKSVNGVYIYDNDWNTRYSNTVYAVNVRGTSQTQDNNAADYSYRRYQERKPYNWTFTDTENGAKFYCSQLCYKAFKVMNGVNLNHNGGIVYPIDLVNSSNTYIVWSK